MSAARITHEKPQILPGKVFCQICGRLMLMEDPNYVCHNAREHGRPESAEISVNADTLRTVIINRIMTLVLSEATVQDVVGRVQEKVSEKKRLQHDQLAETQAALHQMRQRKSQLERLEAGDAGADSSDHQAEFEHVGNRIIALEEEARKHKRENETLNRVNDPKLLRKNAFNLSTYNHPDHLDYTEKILDIFLDSVEVGSATATLKFRMPIPTAAAPEGTLSDDIELVQTLH